MPINDPAQGGLRKVALRILHDGEVLPGAVGFNVHENAYYSAATFSALFAFNVDPASLAFWSDVEKPLSLDIQASLDGGVTYTSLVTGCVDRIRAHLEIGVVEVSGRDNAAFFIDTKTQQTYQNLTASQIVQQLASEHGMTADVTPTTTLVGRYYEMDHERIGAGAFTRTTTEWNLLCELAKKEQFEIWVSGNTLHFKPQAALSSDPFVVYWDQSGPASNAMDLTAERSMSFAKDISVEVRSWNSKEARAHSGQSNAGAGRKFSYVFPNLSQAECQATANRIRNDLSRHERLVSFSVPGDLTLSARDLVRLQGTGSSWDKVFRIDSVDRSISFDAGFVQRVQAKTPLPYPGPSE